jgi:DNA-binding PadR family transcriptional regulator
MKETTMDNKLLLLGILRQREMHGYQLMEFIERDLSTCSDLKKPTAYYLLKQMAEDGWISEEQVQEGNRPPRRVFRLTTSGEAEFNRMLRANLSAYTPSYFSNDIGLAFVDQLPPSEARPLLDRRRAALTSALAILEAVPQHRGSFQYAIDHQITHLRSELGWLDHVISDLQTQTTVADQQIFTRSRPENNL